MGIVLVTEMAGFDGGGGAGGGGGGGSEEEDAAALAAAAAAARTPVGRCDASTCKDAAAPKCSNAGRRKRTCGSELPGLEELAFALLNGIDLKRPRWPLVLSRAEARFDDASGGSETGPVVVLPEGITHNKTGRGDVWKMDVKLYGLLPPNATHLYDRGTPPLGLGRGGPRSLGRCAVVGNSGGLLHSLHGEAIDSHDVVYRFNQAPVEGYQQYVGARSSHESLNSAWVKQLVEGRRKASQNWNWRKEETALVVFELFDPSSIRSKSIDQFLQKERWWQRAYERLRATYPERQFVVISPSFMAWAFMVYTELKARFIAAGLGAFTGEKPMSGFYAILFLYQACDELDLYGFAPYHDGDRTDPLAVHYHYFDGAVPRAGSHSFALARYIYELLEIDSPDKVRIHDT
mmetsp:Transcript_24964/g.81773  ORF Transcript_24964/g.81773 Transcript_24964/m.81773 type:complete len:405 (+) Transcript_24964:140-1354(+)